MTASFTSPSLSRQAVDEPIAVVGLACRLPKASTPEEFWRLLRDGGDAITEAPEGRWESEELPMRHGGFLDQVDRFDPGFFGIAPARPSPWTRNSA